MNRPTEEQLSDYVNNHLSPKDAKKVLEWLSTSDGQAYLNQRLEADFAALDQGQKTLLKPKVTADDILRSAESQQKQPAMVKQPPKWGVARLAASVALIVAMLGGLIYFLTGWTTYEEYQTAFAESADVRLPDGSIVHMSGNSKLKFAKEWGKDEAREVWFEGEGYFDVVKKQAANKFTVKTPRNFDVQVLGTTFTVTARESASRVVLETGAIALHVANDSGADQIMMAPGDLVEMDQTNDLLIKKEVRPEIYTSRKDDKLVFDKTPLKEITRILKDDYGFTVVVNDSEILEEKFTGVVPSKDVETLLAGLRSLLDVKIIRDKNIIKLIH
ncbi:Fe2+-dicitrate sensor protein [Echinicola strongylocentroti]|uniref:Fe2+-dicitrate sensor protein n=1 Tax=Echinicola strongylocentroti TaxID=1795355 RepID=A0A2Z4IR15_9BACT|nr:FecR domain-containing protein [Echinicola strongylocentroti]AWW33264.1 Fe2+-dicitrate sensor protein [Echinicola strongylocentroti]